MEIDLPRLRHILAIAKVRSFSRAAAQLNITQPALSRSIATFEQGFGFRLFDRSRSGVTPTTLGKLAIAEAENVLRATRSLDLNLKLYAKGEAGEVAIGVGPLMASLLLPSLGKHLLQTRRGLKLHTLIRSPALLVQELLEDRIELIFGNSWAVDVDPAMAIESLGVLPMKLMARARHPLAGQSGLSIADLQRYPIASATKFLTTGLTGEAGAFVCDNYHVLRDLVLETDCIWLSATAMVGEDIAEGRMTVLELADFRPVDSDVSLITRRGRTVSPVAMAVVEHIRIQIASLGDGR